MKYEEYMQEQKEKKNLPGVCFKKPKKILKKRDHVPSQIALNEATTVLVNAKVAVPHCSPVRSLSSSSSGFENVLIFFWRAVCNGTFFPELRMV